jgi:hypothetical protein
MSMHGGHEPTSHRVRNDPPASGTAAGADMTARMSGVRHEEPYAAEDSRSDVHRTDRPYRDERAHVVEEVRPTDRRHGVLLAKTSAAAVFSLVFGLAALFCALTAILAPAAVLFGLIGIVVAIAGFKMVKRPGVTGKGVAIGGLVTSILGLLLGAAVMIGAAVIVNDEARLDQLQNQIENLRDDLPSTSELRSELPG